MKKLTKGAIAAAAGVTLLLSGGGTLAYWNDSVNGGSATITAGDLRLTQSGTPTWKIKHTSGAETAVTDIAAVRIVPGDQLIYTGAFNVAGTGDNLAFTVGLTNNAITAASASTPADVALASRLTKTAKFTVASGTAIDAGTESAKVVVKSQTAKNTPITVSVVLDWPFGTAASPAADNPAKTGKVNLSAFAVTATQVDGN